MNSLNSFVKLFLCSGVITKQWQPNREFCKQNTSAGSGNPGWQLFWMKGNCPRKKWWKVLENWWIFKSRLKGKRWLINKQRIDSWDDSLLLSKHNEAGQAQRRLSGCSSMERMVLKTSHKDWTCCFYSNYCDVALRKSMWCFVNYEPLYKCTLFLLECKFFSQIISKWLEPPWRWHWRVWLCTPKNAALSPRLQCALKREQSTCALQLQPPGGEGGLLAADSPEPPHWPHMARTQDPHGQTWPHSPAQCTRRPKLTRSW